MTDPKRENGGTETHLDQQKVIREGMQGATGETDANGLEKNFDRDEKLSELQDNLAEVTADRPGGE